MILTLHNMPIELVAGGLMELGIERVSQGICQDGWAEE